MAGPTPSVARLAGWPLLVGAALRTVCIGLLAADIPHTGDSDGYLTVARHIVEHGEYTGLGFAYGDDQQGLQGVRPPLYPFLVAAGLDTDRDPAEPFPGVYGLQVLFDLATLLLCVDLARRRFGARAARATAWIYALLPAAVLYPSLLVLTEPVFGFVTILGLWCLQRVDDTRTAGVSAHLAWAAALGLILGVGMLTKEAALVVLLAVLGSLVLLWRGVTLARRAATLLTVALTAVLTLLPWLLYTQEEYGVVLPTGTYGHLALIYENMPPGDDHVTLWYGPPTYEQKIASVLDAYWRSMTDHTALFLKRAWWRLRVLVGPEVMLPTYVSISRDGYEPEVSRSMAVFYADAWNLQGAWGAWVQYLTTLGSLAFFTLAAAGMVGRHRGAVSGATLLYLLGFLASIVLTVSQDRYRFGLLAAFAPFAGAGFVSLGDPQGEARADRRRVVAAALLVGLVLGLTMLVLPAPPRPEAR